MRELLLSRRLTMRDVVSSMPLMAFDKGRKVSSSCAAVVAGTIRRCHPSLISVSREIGSSKDQGFASSLSPICGAIHFPLLSPSVPRAISQASTTYWSTLLIRGVHIHKHITSTPVSALSAALLPLAER